MLFETFEINVYYSDIFWGLMFNNEIKTRKKYDNMIAKINKKSQTSIG